MQINEIKSALQNVTLLFVEDEESLRRTAGMGLKNVFREVILASDGQEALDILNQRRDIDVILSDINMPRLSGTDLLKKIRGNGNNIPFVFMTAYTDKDKMDLAIEYNADGYVVKPLDLKAVMIELAKIMVSQ